MKNYPNKRLGVNIDHVATLRNARGELYPDPLKAAMVAEVAGADNITCHLREDRRHIRDDDVKRIKQSVHTPLNFEIAATPEMIDLACQLKPHAVTLVPERRQELTTEGGLNLRMVGKQLEDPIKALKDAGILVSLFVDAKPEIMDQVLKLGADAVECHTGELCRNLNTISRSQEGWEFVNTFSLATQKAYELGLQVHVGHGLNYQNTQWMQCLPHVEEANIGHAIIAHSLFVGLDQAIKKMKTLLNDPKYHPFLGPERQ